MNAYFYDPYSRTRARTRVPVLMRGERPIPKCQYDT